MIYSVLGTTLGGADTSEPNQIHVLPVMFINSETN